MIILELTSGGGGELAFCTPNKSRFSETEEKKVRIRLLLTNRGQVGPEGRPKKPCREGKRQGGKPPPRGGVRHQAKNGVKFLILPIIRGKFASAGFGGGQAMLEAGRQEKANSPPGGSRISGKTLAPPGLAPPRGGVGLSLKRSQLRIEMITFFAPH